MPKAAMNEDHTATTREHQIRPSRQAFAVEAVPIPEPVDQASDRHFGTCAATAHSRHDLRAAFGADGVQGAGGASRGRSTILKLTADGGSNRPGVRDAVFPQATTSKRL